MSQSLSSRAMSFDRQLQGTFPTALCLNPFRAGRCLSTNMAGIKMRYAILSLNPFRAGRCLSTIKTVQVGKHTLGLNPFRAGRCLSTDYYGALNRAVNVSIPFEQGDVFRLQRYAGGRNHAAFQTHFPIFLEG